MGTGGSAPPHSTTYFEVQKLITSTCFTKPTLRFQKTLSFSHVQVSKIFVCPFYFTKHELTVSCFRQRAKSRTSERSIHLHLELTRTGAVRSLIDDHYN